MEIKWVSVHLLQSDPESRPLLMRGNLYSGLYSTYTIMCLSAAKENGEGLQFVNHCLEKSVS